MITACVFDTETTGLVENRTIKDDKLPEIIDFYGAIFEVKSGKIVKELELLIKPKNSLPEDTIKITGLTDADLVNAPPFKKIADSIKSLIESSPLVIGHNLAYDKEMIDIEMSRLKKEVKWPAGLCTVEQTYHIKGFRLNLNALHTHLFGEGFKDAHRARADAQATMRCAVELFKRGEL